MKSATHFLYSLFIISFLLISCHSSEQAKSSKTVLTDKIYKPGIVLTFDDDYIDDWSHADALLHPLHWKATFFICKYSAFTEQ